MQSQHAVYTSAYERMENGDKLKQYRRMQQQNKIKFECLCNSHPVLKYLKTILHIPGATKWTCEPMSIYRDTYICAYATYIYTH